MELFMGVECDQLARPVGTLTRLNLPKLNVIAIALFR